MIKALLACMLAGGISFAMTHQLVRRRLPSWAMDAPDETRKRHLAPVPRTGGIPLAAVLVAALAWVAFAGREWGADWMALTVGAALIFSIGLVDDFRRLGAKFKLFGQILVALVVYAIGLRMDVITYPVGSFSLDLHAWGILFTVFWLIAVPNIINLIDGADGLAAGLGLFLFAVLGYVGWAGGQPEVAVVAMAMAGGCLGFLCFNFPPARIFLGDGGAYLIGFMIAALSLKSDQKGSVAGVLFVVVIALGLPIADTLFALMRRAVRGFPLFRADAEHIHHRLQSIGLSDRRMVFGMYLASVVLSLLGLSVLWTQGRTLPIVLGIVFLAAIFSVRYLGYVWSWSQLTMQVSRALARRSDVRYALALAQVLLLEIDRMDAREFASTFHRDVGRLGFKLRPGPEGLSFALFDDAEGAIHLSVLGGAKRHDELHWSRMAECLQQVARQARRRWEHELVLNLGREMDE